MDKGVNPHLFVNDGSFMEKFRQLQQEKQEKEAGEESKSGIPASSTPSIKPIVISNKRLLDVKSSDVKKPNPSSSNGKLAFSLKQKSKVAPAPIRLAEDEEEDRGEADAGISDESSKRQKLGQFDSSKPSSEKGDAPVPPRDPTVKNAADKLASFVAKNGRHLEDFTRQKNPGDTPFKFLFDTSCSDYKYYQYRLLEEEQTLGKINDSQALHTENKGAANSRTPNSSQKTLMKHHSNFETPASALYGSNEDTKAYATTTGKTFSYGESSGPPSSDPIAVMEYYMKKAAQEERKRQPRQSKDEMPPPASLQAPGRKGHHMGDFIPPEELEKFLASCSDAVGQKFLKETAELSRIQADNVGHKLLSKMGWKEGEGLGSSKGGRADPVMAGNVKLNNLGIGAENPGQVTADDDIYEQYKKRMMLGYRYRPNPLKILKAAGILFLPLAEQSSETILLGDVERLFSSTSTALHSWKLSYFTCMLFEILEKISEFMNLWDVLTNLGFLSGY
ncbi:SURP and G-patch domain-containing protein 1-like protein [Apostasia shenzhenica]|uniref:SURP and G-patch domain-containing protein 1-like protein n=1 Tax=Apostasia shenzhenica TaxID=1088818 RepID=A0A2I0A716_9ASPA|nr:SURP and G-patch domain-containing protein 1-like protein [Apostasia shenzhenica]